VACSSSTLEPAVGRDDIIAPLLEHPLQNVAESGLSSAIRAFKATAPSAAANGRLLYIGGSLDFI